MLHPIIDSGFGDMEQGADFGDLVQGFVGKTRRFVSGGNGLLFFNIADFFPDNLPDLLPVLFRFIREQHGGNEVTIAHRFFHHFSF